MMYGPAVNNPFKRKKKKKEKEKRIRIRIRRTVRKRIRIIIRRSRMLPSVMKPSVNFRCIVCIVSDWVLLLSSISVMSKALAV